MAAVLALVVAFIVCTLVGFGWTALLSTGKTSLRNLLISPAIGIASLVIPTFSLSNLGLTTQSFGIALVSGEVIVAAALITWRKPSLMWRDVFVLIVMVAAGFALLATPMLSFDFNWIGFANPDVGNYALAAQRYVHHGFSDLPTALDLLYHRDVSGELFFLDSIIRERPGAQLLLALFSVCAHQTTPGSVMPIAVCSYLATIAATASLLAERGRPSWAVPACGIVIAASSLEAFGTYLALLGQCIGLPLFIGSVSVFGAVAEPKSMRVGNAVLVAILLSGLAIIYPELAPFLVAGIGLCFVCLLIRRRIELLPLTGYMTLILAAVAVILNVYLPTVLATALVRSASLAGSQHLFEQYLVPSGLATLWGFTPLFLLDAEPWQSVNIAAGVLCLGVCALAALYHAYKGNAAATVFLVMLAAAGYLFHRSLDFPLFKTAMYIQPLLGTCLCLAAISFYQVLDRVGRPRTGTVTAILALALISLGGLRAQRFYVAASRDLPHTVRVGISAIANGSPRHILDELNHAAALSKRNWIIFDSTDLTVIDYAGIFSRGKTLVVPGGKYLDWGVDLHAPLGTSIAVSRWMEEYNAKYAQLHPYERFSLLARDRPSGTSFLLDDTLKSSGGTPETADYWISSPRLSVLNRFGVSRDIDDVTVEPYRNIHNHLIELDHSLAVTLPWERKKVALTQPPEPDQLNPGGDRVVGFGRYQLFEILHPSKRLRLIFAETETQRAEGVDSNEQGRIPPVALIGKRRVSLTAIGYGSARLISPEIEPRSIDGRAFIALDMGRRADQQRYRKSGLMELFGRAVPLDNSELVGFARDISVISPQQYKDLRVPERMDTLDAITHDDHLFYSGMYEDGFVNRRARFLFRSDRQTGTLLISGDLAVVPPSGTTRIAAFVDGRLVLAARRRRGAFALHVPLHIDAGRHQVDITADNAYVRPAPDTRTVSVQLSRLGFYHDADLSRSLDIYDLHRPLQLGRGWFAYEAYGGQRFRWVSNDAEIQIASDLHSEILELSAEPGPGVYYRPFDLVARLGSVVLYRTTVSGGPIRIRIPPHANDETLVLHVNGGGAATASDPRVLNFRVMHLSLARSVHDIPAPDETDFGANWNGVEHYKGEVFRWAGNDAVINFSGARKRVRLLVEPGPSIDGDVMQLDVQAPDASIQSFNVRGRSYIDVNVSRSGPVVFHIRNGGRTIPSDLRTLDFRVFRIE